MGIRRLGIENPAAESPTSIFTATEPYLTSIVATNTASATTAEIRVWVQPFGSTGPSQYAYIVYDLPVDALNSYETFRFAINTGDEIYVESSTANVSFQAYGLIQYDVKLGAGVSSYSPSAPSNPIAGMIWVDSDGTIEGSDAKPIYIYNGSDWVSTAASAIDTSANYTFDGDNTFTGTNSFTGTVTLSGYEKEIPLQNTAPESPEISDLWVDNTNPLQPLIKVYDGDDWVLAGSAGGEEPIDEFFLMGA
jgi:hypothetical protein